MLLSSPPPPCWSCRLLYSTARQSCWSYTFKSCYFCPIMFVTFAYTFHTCNKHYEIKVIIDTLLIPSTLVDWILNYVCWLVSRTNVFFINCKRQLVWIVCAFSHTGTHAHMAVMMVMLVTCCILKIKYLIKMSKKNIVLCL